MKVRVHIFVSGKVQGVFFRSETRTEAYRRHVAGWIRNLPDGRVEAVFEGEEKDVHRLVEFCQKGPAGAEVSKTEESAEAYTGEFKDFRIAW
jgi:acylphosphatase